MMKSATQHKLNSSTKVWYIFILSTIILCHILFSCSDKKGKQPPLFEALDAKSTGIDFTNKLTPTPQFNMFKYMYFYNGAGVGVDGNARGCADGFCQIFVHIVSPGWPSFLD